MGKLVSGDRHGKIMMVAMAFDKAVRSWSFYSVGEIDQAKSGGDGIWHMT